MPSLRDSASLLDCHSLELRYIEDLQLMRQTMPNIEFHRTCKGRPDSARVARSWTFIDCVANMRRGHGCAVRGSGRRVWFGPFQWIRCALCSLDVMKPGELISRSNFRFRRAGRIIVSVPVLKVTP